MLRRCEKDMQRVGNYPEILRGQTVAVKQDRGDPCHAMYLVPGYADHLRPFESALCGVDERCAPGAVPPEAPCDKHERPDIGARAGSLSGEVVCFTGKLPGGITRERATAAVRCCGGTCSGTVTRKTTILVVGSYPRAEYISHKLCRARECKQAGSGIRIISARTFLSLTDGLLEYQLSIFPEDQFPD